MVNSRSFQITTKGYCDVVDITSQALGILQHSDISNGMLNIFIPGSTAAVTTIEYEPGAVADLKSAIERLAPVNGAYSHNERWGDGNGFSHVRAALLGPSLTIPVQGGAALLGTWQQIALVDFDNRSRNRKVLVTLMGE